MEQLDAAGDYWDCGDEEDACMTCHGEGWGIVGLDWDGAPDEYGADDGEAQECWNCHGSGLAKDQWLW